MTAAERSLPPSIVARGTRSGIVYAITGVLQRGSLILLLPLVALILTPGEYGQVAIITSIGVVVGSIFGFGLEAVVIRGAVRLRGQGVELATFTNTVGLFLIVVPVTASIIVGLAIAITPDLLARMSVPPDALLVGLVAAGLQTSITVFAAALLRANERRREYVGVILTQLATSIVLLLVLVVVLRTGVHGWVVSSLVSSLVGLAVALKLIDHHWDRNVSRQHLVTALALGLPLLPHTLSHWALGLSDRLLLGGLSDTAHVGIYNLAYQLAAPIGLIAVALNQGVMPIYAEAHESLKSRLGLARLATYQIHITGVLGLGVVLVAPPLVDLLFPVGYQDAQAYLPWIAIGYVLFGFYLLPANEITLMLGRTRGIWVPTALAAATNVVLNVALIPRFGALAAAVNTAIAYAVLLAGILAYRMSLGGPSIQLESRRIAVGLLGSLLAAGGGYAMTEGLVGAQALIARSVVLIVVAIALLTAHLTIWRQPTARAGAGRSSSQ